jgi:hypothetical protein
MVAGDWKNLTPTRDLIPDVSWGGMSPTVHGLGSSTILKKFEIKPFFYIEMT